MSGIDLNADLGELTGPAGEELDASLIALMSSVNVATGGHAGDASSMTRVCRAAAEAGVSIGAHLSYPDHANFGRVTVAMPPRELRDSLSAQLATLIEIADRVGTTVDYVKPHGALYHDAADDSRVSGLLLDVVGEAGIGVLTLPDRHLHRAALDSGVPAFTEAFADRAYRADGTLVPRREPGAVIEDEAVVQERVLAIAHRRPITATDGQAVRVNADSICLHGDTPGAVSLARAVVASLTRGGIRIEPFTGPGS